MCCRHLGRRDFLRLTTGAVAGIGLSAPFLSSPAGAAGASEAWDPDAPYAIAGKELKVKPILMYALPRRREAASWKSWGGVQTEPSASEELGRISRELAAIPARAGFPLAVLDPVKVKSVEEAARARGGDQDVTIVYPATGSGDLLRSCLSDRPDTILFVRHRSGPIYYWYEALSVRYLDANGGRAAGGDAPSPGGASVHDVVVDDAGELLWRLRAFHGVKNFLGARVVALGGAGGKYDPDAPRNARERYGFDIVEVGYDDFSKRLEGGLSDRSLLAKAGDWTKRYLSLPNTTLETDEGYVRNAFLLHALFKGLMKECNARIFTIQGCMSTIIPMARTTACLSLSLLNDEGYLAFCESDFVIIPPGVLLHHISGKPVFLHNSTFPHKGVVTCAHCTCPRRMDGVRYEPARILTHYESEYGAAPKVEMPEGQVLTFIDPEYSTGRWVGIKGRVEGNPFYEICRSQQDVEILGDWRKLLKEARDSHWVMAYGDCLNEVGYASRRIGVTWDNVSGGGVT